MTWINDVKVALDKLGGEAHLSKIYSVMNDIKTNRGDRIGELEEHVRDTLQKNSRGEGKDLFESVYGVEKGKGVWRIKIDGS